MAGFKNFIPPKCKTLRDGKMSEIDATNLVKGDIVELKAGDRIPADVRLIEAFEFKVDNSSLTGEAEELLRKNECTNDDPFESANIAFFGTLCKSGKGRGMVFATGDRTLMGAIAKLTTQTET